MTFAEVEALVGPLPSSARTHRAWWANDSKVQALAWRAAGWQVSSVNQLADHVVFARSARGGTAGVPRTLVEPRSADTPVKVDSAAADMGPTEETVQANLVAFLVSVGWQIARVANTATKERGIDVLATLGERTLAVEVKGYPSTRYADVRRAGEVKPTAPSVQARHWFAQAVLKAMLTRSDHPDYELAIALPRMPTYQALAGRTKISLDRLEVAVFFVEADGQVHAY
jgi:hypothetical protein